VNITAAGLIPGLLFGIIGFAAFAYGKKQSEWLPMVAGLTLMTYPYFVANVVAQYAIGAALVTALFVFRDR